MLEGRSGCLGSFNLLGRNFNLIIIWPALVGYQQTVAFLKELCTACCVYVSRSLVAMAVRECRLYARCGFRSYGTLATIH